MRTKNSIRNSIFSVGEKFVSMFVGFIARAIFIRILGAEFLGLNSLYTNILTMLNFFELGIGIAINYKLYEPIANKDTEKIKSLMVFYKKAYTLIALIIAILGLMLLPFLPMIIGKINIDVNIYFAYILFLIGTVISYFLAYKRGIIYADQKQHVISIVNIVYTIVLNALQLLILWWTKNYYLYLILVIICQLLENVALAIISHNMYPFLKEKNVKPLDKETGQDIITRVKALAMHQIGGVVLNGTDSLIISYFFGVVTVGIYSSYYMVINAVKQLIKNMMSSVTASVGNLLVTEKAEKRFQVFKNLRFLNFWIGCFVSISILLIMQPFVKVWLGEDYLLGFSVLVVLVFNCFQSIMRYSFGAFKEAAAIFVEDRFVPIIEAIMNLVFSIILLKMFGLIGVFLGTMLSSVAYWCYSYPKFVYKKLFNRGYIDYAKETIAYILLFIIIAIITCLISALFVFENSIVQIIVNLIICLIIPNLIIYIIFRKDDKLLYFKNLVFKILSKN